MGHCSLEIASSENFNLCFILKWGKKKIEWLMLDVEIIYSWSFQSYWAMEHSRNTVLLWLNPQSDLLLHTSSGLRDSPCGAIQFKMGPFKLFVSLAQALEAPFWTYQT